MDNPQQDNLHFSAYAVAYHDAYHAIKAADPSARVAVGAITSLGPGNIEYLGQFVNQYEDLYGAIPAGRCVDYSHLQYSSIICGR